MKNTLAILLVASMMITTAAPMFGLTAGETPPPPADKQGQDNYSIEQAISDQAQLNTLAFDGLGFLTGDLFTDSFLPPGKVADFFGFQYLRDVTPEGNGHNTSFVTRIANNLLSTLNSTQYAALTALATSQSAAVNRFAQDRYPLMVAFRRNMDGDIPAGSVGLSREAVMAYSAELYGLDAGISIERAVLYAGTLNSLNASQRQFLDGMVAGGFASWADIPDQVDKQNLSKDVCVLIMTYASEMFGWYAGNVTADTYFCPERQADYFGGFYIKDAPAVGNEGYKIDETITGEKGQKFLDALDASQRATITGLVDIQRGDLVGIVAKRLEISTELRVALAGGTIDEEKVLSLARSYGRLDGEISYYYATAFAKVNATLTSQQRTNLVDIKDLKNFTSPADKIWLYSELVNRPAIPSTDFLFATGLAMPDTGQTGSFTETKGEDSDYTLNSPAYKDNGDGTVTDTVTGLVWQKSDGGEMTWENASIYAGNLVLGGKDDWRLPSSEELFNLMDHGARNPALNRTFNVSGAEYFWSSAAELDDAGKVWSANTGGGIGPHPKDETVSAGGAKSFHALCVRGGSLDTGYGLDDCGDGTVADDSTGLMWQKVQAGNMTWEQAIAYCENLSLGGYGDWRLPNVKELRSVSNDSLAKPSIDTAFFPGALSEKFWSSTTELNDATRAWYVDFTYGLVTYEAKTEGLAVRAVRGGGLPAAASSGNQTNGTLAISGTKIAPGQPGASDTVRVTARVTAGGQSPSVKLYYSTGGSGGSSNTVFRETMGTTDVKPWAGNGTDNPWTVQTVNRDNIEQRAEANYGPGNPCGMEFGTGTNNLTETMVWNTQGIDARGNGTYVEFALWADGLEGTDGWTFQLDIGAGFVTRLSELTGSNHAWQKYHYDLEAAERVEGLKMRFQFRAGDQGDRIRVDCIFVNLTEGGQGSTAWTSVAMADDGAHGDGAAADGTYGGNIPAFPAGTTVRYYIIATGAGGLKVLDPPWVPTVTYSYTITGGAGSHSLGIRSFQPRNDPTVNETQSVTFSADAQDSLQHALNYFWSVDGKGKQGTSGSFEYKPGYNDSGVHRIKVTIKGSEGVCNLTASREWNVTVLEVNRAPTCSVELPKAGSSLTAGTSASFRASGTDADGQALTYTWDFGDGQTASGQEVSHKYAGKGTYTVTLTVSDGTARANATMSVNVAEDAKTPAASDSGALVVPALLAVIAVLLVVIIVLVARGAKRP